MSLYALEPGEIVYWEFSSGRLGEVELTARASENVDTAIVHVEDWRPNALLEELVYLARSLGRREHEHVVRVHPRVALVAVVRNSTDKTAAVDAHVTRRK